MQNSLQAGLEYDSNVYKKYGGSEDDFLTRLLVKSRGRAFRTDQWQLRWNYQGGGKVFFREGPQSLLIQYFEAPVSFRPLETVRFIITPEVKVQNERNNLDAAAAVADDVNEDYTSVSARLEIPWELPGGFLLQPGGAYTRFVFPPRDEYSFHREEGTLLLRKNLGEQLIAGGCFAYNRQQFDASPREDDEIEGAAFFQYTSGWIASLRYTFEKGYSSDDRFDFTNHKISLLLSVPFGSRAEPDSDESEGEPMFAFHVLATLQLKEFPGVFAETTEGIRYLLTDAEDDNFNSVLVKFTYHPTSFLAIESKYTRYSNELSNQQSSFSRNLVYSGVRYSF